MSGMMMLASAVRSSFAVISVSYPAGSVCTCSVNGASYTAWDTSGTWMFLIPRAGTWTVSCTNGSENASQTVSITTRHQAVNVTLTYNYYIVRNGQIQHGYTFMYSHTASPTQYTSGNYYVLEAPYAGNVGCYVSPIDISGYSTLTLISQYDNNLYQCPGVAVWNSEHNITNETNATAFAWSQPIANQDVTTSLNIAHVNGVQKPGVVFNSRPLMIKELYLGK